VLRRHPGDCASICLKTDVKRVQTCRHVVTGENPANHVFVDLNVERQGHLLGDSRTTPGGITLLHFDDRWLSKTPSDLKMQRLRSSVRDELPFHCSFCFCCLQFPASERAAGGDSRPSAPTGRSPKQRAASLALQPHRPAVVGCVIAILVGLATQPADRAARHGHPLAQASFRLVLDKEIAAPPEVPAEIRDLIRRMSQVNPL
jgi:hypothetical protein